MMDALQVSAAERTLLEALVVAPDLPAIQVRAQVVLRAADGIADDQIAVELSMRRKDVLHWRKRFQGFGIRGLWDVPGPGLKKRVSPEKERAVVGDVLYSVLHWDARLLAQKHGLSRSAVNRIFAKHGIVRGEYGRVDIERLKIFADPLFGVTVSGIAGLYYGTSGVLALSSTRESFSELGLMTVGSSVSQACNGLVSEIRRLAEFRKSDRMIVATEAPTEASVFLQWLNRIEAGRESKSDIHLLTDSSKMPPLGGSVPEWLAEHPHFQIHPAPVVIDLFWFHLVKKSFEIIAAFPVQARLVDDVTRMTSYLAGMPDAVRRAIIAAVEPSPGKEKPSKDQ